MPVGRTGAFLADGHRGLAIFGWLRGGSPLGGVMLGIVGTGLGLLAAFVAVLMLLGTSGAS